MLIEEPISTPFTAMRKRELEFPPVTVCSLSFLDTTVLKYFSNDQYNKGELVNRFEAMFAYNQPVCCRELQSLYRSWSHQESSEFMHS